MTTSLQRPRLWTLVALAGLLGAAFLAVERGSAAEPIAHGGAGKAVSIVNFAFKPGTVKVKRGARVTFANNAGTTHTATSGSFNTKHIAPGTSKTVRFDKRGTFAYHCEIHPFMKGKIVVE